MTLQNVIFFNTPKEASYADVGIGDGVGGAPNTISDASLHFANKMYNTAFDPSKNDKMLEE